MSKLNQCDKILKIMLEVDNNYKIWYATDFQNTVGYEATARLSDLVRKYPVLFRVVKKGRYRGLQIKWEEKENIKEMKEFLKWIEEDK